jgi:hypothetical protein
MYESSFGKKSMANIIALTWCILHLLSSVAEKV